MALSRCPDCGQMISSRAKACPRCGGPNENFTGFTNNKTTENRQPINQRPPQQSVSKQQAPNNQSKLNPKQPKDDKTNTSLNEHKTTKIGEEASIKNKKPIIFTIVALLLLGIIIGTSIKNYTNSSKEDGGQENSITDSITTAEPAIKNIDTTLIKEEKKENYKKPLEVNKQSDNNTPKTSEPNLQQSASSATTTPKTQAAIPENNKSKLNNESNGTTVSPLDDSRNYSRNMNRPVQGQGQYHKGYTPQEKSEQKETTKQRQGYYNQYGRRFGR